MIVVDTGPLLAAADADDDDHLACSALIERRARELVIPAAVVVEVCWLIARTLGATAEGEFLASIADEELRVEPQSLDDYHRASELVVTYADLGLDMVSARVHRETFDGEDGWFSGTEPGLGEIAGQPRVGGVDGHIDRASFRSAGAFVGLRGWQVDLEERRSWAGHPPGPAVIAGGDDHHLADAAVECFGDDLGSFGRRSRHN